MATKFTAGTVINSGLIVVGVDADAPPATPSPSPEPAPEPAPSANWLVVGANGHDIGNETGAGAAYVFDANDLSAQPTKLTPFDYNASDHFGHSVAVNGDNIFIGSWRDDDTGSNSGSVYVYDANDLSVQPTKLTSSDGGRFGTSLYSSDDKIIVGAFQVNSNRGAAYVYDANDLSAQPTKLTAFDGAADDRFGWAVAANSNKVVVGSYYDDDKGDRSGSVYVYDANDLSAQPTKLTAFDGGSLDQFGRFIDVTDDKIIISSYYDDDNGSNSGSVYVFDANDLSAQPTKLTAFDGEASNFFGSSVSVTDDIIVVGAFGGAGAVYVYDANDLSAQPTKLTAFDGVDDDNFGEKVLVDSNKIFVGVRQDDVNIGSVYIYDVSDLTAQPTKLTAFGGVSGDQFGFSVALG